MRIHLKASARMVALCEERLAALGDVRFVAGYAGCQGAKLREQRGDDRERGVDDGRVGRQRALGFDVMDSFFDDRGLPDAVRVEEGDHRSRSRALSRLQGWP